MLRWVLEAWGRLMIISNEGMDLNDPKEFDDPQIFDDPSYSIIPAIRWSPAIQWSIGRMDFDNPKVYGDTFISDGLVLFLTGVGSFFWSPQGPSQRRLSNFSSSPSMHWTVGAHNWIPTILDILLIFSNSCVRSYALNWILRDIYNSTLSKSKLFRMLPHMSNWAMGILSFNWEIKTLLAPQVL